MTALIIIHHCPLTIDLPKARLTSSMSSFDTYDYDVLVIGAGGAGLRAAIEAAAMEFRLV